MEPPLLEDCGQGGGKSARSQTFARGGAGRGGERVGGRGANLDVAEEEAHDLLGLGGERVGEAGEPHLLADPDLRQRHLRRPAAADRLGFRVGRGAGRRTRCRRSVLCCASSGLAVGLVGVGSVDDGCVAGLACDVCFADG